MEQYLAIEEYLPHKKPMLLLDEVLYVDDQRCITRVAIERGGRLDMVLNGDGSLSNYFAIELISQTIGVFSGWHNIRNHEEISLGMVLGARDLAFTVEKFECGEILIIEAVKQIFDGRFASFEGSIKVDDKVVCHGRITTFKSDLNEILELMNKGQQL